MIDYSYEVIRKDTDNKVMDVKFSADGYESIEVGMPIPTVDENFEEKIRQSAPIGLWLQSKAEYQDIQEGLKGTVTNTETEAAALSNVEKTPEELARMANAQMWSEIDFERRVAAALVKFGVLPSDPTAIPVVKL